MFANSYDTKNAVKDSIENLIARTLQDAQENVHSEKKYKPLLYELFLPDEVYKGAAFERKFFSEFGEIWKDLVVAVAKLHWGYCVKNYAIFGTVKSGRLRRIAQVLSASYSTEEEKPNASWQTELAYILKGKGQPIPVRITCDIYIEDPVSHKKYAFNLKAPLSNSNQPKVSKEKLLKLYSMEPLQVDSAYYAISYNSYEESKNDSWDSPARWFNLKEDPVVLNGYLFWEKIGGVGTYQTLIDTINEFGPEYKERIYREYLGIEPG